MRFSKKKDYSIISSQIKRETGGTTKIWTDYWYSVISRLYISDFQSKVKLYFKHY